MLRIHRRKEGLDACARFRTADKERAAGPQRKVKNVEDLFLRGSIKINEEVAARDQIDAGERRIPQ